MGSMSIRVNTKLREKAFEELGKPVEEIEELKTNYFQNAARLLGRPDANLGKGETTTT